VDDIDEVKDVDEVEEAAGVQVAVVNKIIPRNKDEIR